MSDESTRRVLTCVYCGQAYPQDTPAWGDQVLTDHIKNCDKHPMKRLAEDNVKLRKALLGLVGTDNQKELDDMETAIRGISTANPDKAHILKAIAALRETDYGLHHPVVLCQN